MTAVSWCILLLYTELARAGKTFFLSYKNNSWWFIQHICEYLLYKPDIVLGVWDKQGTEQTKTFAIF